jgi:hypothetical protein
MATRLSSAERVMLLSASGLVVVVGAVMFLVGAVGSLSFFGQSSSEAFQRWADRPLLVAGGVAALVGVVALFVTLAGARQLVVRTVAGAALAACVVAVVVGLAVHAQRSHPQGFERRSVEALAVPPGRAVDQVTQGSTPLDHTAVAGPSSDGPPVAVRSWSPASCDQVHQLLLAWADRGSVRVPASFVASGQLSCLWFATRHGFPVRGEVQGSTAVVVVSPPGVGP